MIRSHFICLRLYKRVRNLAIPLFQIGFEGALYIRILRRNDASIYSPFALLTNTIKLRVKACPQNLLYKGAPNCVIDQGMNSIKEIMEVVDICNKWFGRKMALEDEFRIESHHIWSTIESHFLLQKI